MENDLTKYWLVGQRLTIVYTIPLSFLCLRFSVFFFILIHNLVAFAFFIGSWPRCKTEDFKWALKGSKVWISYRWFFVAVHRCTMNVCRWYSCYVINIMKIIAQAIKMRCVKPCNISQQHVQMSMMHG